MKSSLRIAVAAIVIAGASAARADLLVIEQSGTGYRAQQKLRDGASLNVPAGAHVKFRRLPEGTDIVIEGPFDGPISTYKKGDCAWWNPACKKDNPVTPGGMRGAVPAPGATRGMD